MTLVSSQRERRLWALTLAVVVAIYSTLGLAAKLSGVLSDSGLIEASVFLSMIMILATIITQGLKTRPSGIEIGVVLGVVAVYALVFLRMTASPAERTHLMERASQGRRVPMPALIAALAAALLGVLDECIQFFLPSRVFDPIDILFNVLASVMAVVAMVLLGWARRRAGRFHRP